MIIRAAQFLLKRLKKYCIIHTLAPCSIALICLLCLVLVFTAQAKKAFSAEQELIVYNAKFLPQKTALHISFSCALSDVAMLRDLLKDGAALEFIFTFSLEKELFLWGNSTQLQKEKHFYLRHDPLSREFIFLSLADPTIEKRNKNLNTLLNKSLQRIQFPLFTAEELGSLGKSSNYTLRIEAELRHSEAPPWLLQGRLFWSPEIAKIAPLHIPFPDSKSWLNLTNTF